MKNFVIKFIGSWFLSGFLKPAPGTWGTIAGTASFFALVHYFDIPLMDLLIISTVIFIVGIPVASYFEEITQTEDNSSIVIDEVAAVFFGYSFLLLFRDYDIFSYDVMIALYFVLFRLFDIIKPFPIKFVEGFLSGGFAIMIDDILAAVYALAMYAGIVYTVQNYFL